jgi:FKBP-type peptidyl-prolyl cis-trans isomerase FklB
MSQHQIKEQLQKFSYSLGLTISSNLLQSGIEDIDSLKFLAGFQDIYARNKPKISMEEANLLIQEHMLAQNEEEALKNFEEGLLFLNNNLHNDGVVETESGLQYKILKKGHGKSPKLNDMIKCQYHGALLDGRVFDSSVERGRPAVFYIKDVIQGWMEALLLMKEGAKWRLFIPPDLAYGESGAGGTIGPIATLIIDVELLEIV